MLTINHSLTPIFGHIQKFSRKKLNKSHWAGLIIAILFTATFYWLNSRQYLSFNMRAADADRFSQAIWNTLHGRFLFATIKEGSILKDHFSPFMALLSPLFLIWSDVRIIYLYQVLGYTVAGLLLYKIVYDRRPALAFVFLLAFFLNPTLHEVALFELRRVTLAVPFVALSLYGLHKENRVLMLIGVILTLLTKEDMGLIVFGIGLFLLIVKRDWKWGLGLSILGLLWAAVMVLVVIPALGQSDYPQIGYFSGWGSSPAEILLNMLTNPVKLLQTIIDQESLAAIWRILLPVAIFLPFLGLDYLLVGLPLLLLMLLSSEPEMHSLQRWYMAPLLPILFFAVGIGLSRLNERPRRWLAAVLLGTTLLGFVLYSPAPLGGNYEPYRYEFRERQKVAWEIIAAVPQDAKVIAQNAFTIQLAHREVINNYPWFEVPEEEIEYIVLGEDFNAYPFDIAEIHWEILNRVADPNNVVRMEAGGIYLLQRGGQPLPSKFIDRVAEDAIRLEKVEVALADERGFFLPAIEEPLTLGPGQTLRVTLYWQALAAPNMERTVSLRIEDVTGALVAQKDTQPSEASRPTSWWEPGWYFRDVYYLTLSPQALPGQASLDLVLYDSFTLQPVSFDNGDEVLHLFEINLVQ